MGQNVISGLILAIVGILLIVNPHGVWAVAERWKTMNAAESSPLFNIMARIVGVVALVIGVLVCTGLLE